MKSESHPQKLCISAWKAFKKDEKLFHVKGSFRSQDIYIFVATFLSSRKTV